MLILQRVAEKVFVVLSLLLFSGAMTWVVAPPHPLYRAIQLLFYAILLANILMLLPRWRKAVRITFKEKLLWVLIAIAVFSILWSELPAKLVLLRGHYSGLDIGILPLLRITLFGIYFATRYSLKEQLRLLTWTFGIAALLSLVITIALPSYGVMGGAASVENSLSIEGEVHAGAWKGVYGHKNFLGRNMALGAVICLLFTKISPKYSWIGWMLFSLSVGLIILSTSKSSLVIFLTIIALLSLYKSLRWNYTSAITFFIAVIFVVGGISILLFDNVENVLTLLGRDITLTGRTDLWGVVLEKIWERPWLGHGYNSFWMGLDDFDGESVDISYAVGWQVPHAHNGFLDIWLDLGLLGLFVFILSFLVVSWRSIYLARLTKTPEGLWPLVYLTFVVLSNLTESSLIREDIYWLLYVTITLSLHKREVFEEYEQENTASYLSEEYDTHVATSFLHSYYK